MKKTPAPGTIALPGDELKKISGGGWIDTLVNLTMSGASFCYRMGVREGKATKMKLKTSSTPC